MVFSSYVFLYVFLPLFLALYFLSPGRWRSLLIALASYVFYGWWRADFVLLMLLSTVVDYTCGRGVVRSRDTGRRGRGWVILSCCVNLGLLGYFKYANFGVDTFNALAASFGIERLAWTEVVLPVGLSFYTFQTMSYTIDVYRKEAEPVERFVDFMCYVALFPQLIAGPIVRYRSVAAQLARRTHDTSKAFQGALLFQLGFAKKVLLADTVATVADQAFAASTLTTLEAWIGLLAYTFQIYFDFSGYSDMAIGLGLILGFTFPINFDGPYRSQSVTEFWRRWHISLSSWLRDYLYVPLGGNRKGRVRTYVNLSATMLLGGLWHGAAWTFIAWGAYQGLWLVVERAFGKKSLWAALPAPWRVMVTFVVTMGGWTLFRAADMASAWRYFTWLGFGGASDAGALRYDNLHVAALAVGALIVWALPTSQRVVERPRAVATVVTFALFAAALVQLHAQDHRFFIYYQF